MKSFKLKEQKTFVKVLKEPVASKKKVNWHRRLYLAIAIIAFLYVSNKVYKGHMLIQANGQIELPKQVINFSNDVQLMQFMVDEGERVNKGDTLFSFKVLSNELSEQSVIKNNKPIDWINKERLSARSKGEMADLKIKHLRSRKDIIDKSIRLKESLVLSGLHRESDNLQQLQKESYELDLDLEVVLNERYLLNSLLDELDRSESMYAQLQTQELSLYEEIRYFSSASDGVCGTISYQQNEICYKKDDLLTIHSTDGATINTFFDPTELEYLTEGDEVVISFPDGTESNGYIRKFYISTYALPSEFQKKYEPTERNIVAEVVPVDDEEGRVWKNYYKMDVKVRKQRFDLSFWNTEKRRIATDHRDRPKNKS